MSKSLRYQHFGGGGNLVTITNKEIEPHLHINIYGQNNKIIIKGHIVFVANIDIGTPDCHVSNCNIYIGENTTSNGLRIMMLEDEQEVYIGDDSMIASGVEIWVSDTHVVVDQNGNIINYGKSVKIGKHCWLGRNVKILKNTEISDNTICAFGTIVSGKFLEGNCILAGIPGKVVKRNINWDKRRHKQYKEEVLNHG